MVLRAAAALVVVLTASTAAPVRASCGWVEPPRTFPEGVRWICSATGWADGDTLTAMCDGMAEAVVFRVRHVDTEERGEARWRQAREELRHRSHQRVVADVLAGGVNVGEAMDAAGWSKAECPRQ